jgi:hypothetical protein
MPHCMCAACKIRCQTEGSPADVVAEQCPYCGSVLEPVSDLSVAVGFRLISLDNQATDATVTTDHPAEVDRGDLFVARRIAMLAREQQRDDGDLLYAAAVALPRPGLDR